MGCDNDYLTHGIFWWPVMRYHKAFSIVFAFGKPSINSSNYVNSVKLADIFILDHPTINNVVG